MPHPKTPQAFLYIFLCEEYKTSHSHADVLIFTLLETLDDVFTSVQLSTVFGQNTETSCKLLRFVGSVCVWMVASLLFPLSLCFVLVSFTWARPKHQLHLSHFQTISSAFVIQASFPHKHTHCTFTNMCRLSLISNANQETHFGFHETAISYHHAIFHISYTPTILRLDIPLFQISGYVSTVDETKHASV